GIDIPPPPAPGAPAPEPILHSTRFVLVDGQGRIRGYYDGVDEESMKKLVRDLEAVAGQPSDLAPLLPVGRRGGGGGGGGRGCRGLRPVGAAGAAGPAGGGRPGRRRLW